MTVDPLSRFHKAAEAGWQAEIDDTGYNRRMMSAPQRNLFFPLTVAASGAFIVTILALVATVFGDPQSPANQFLDRNLGVLLAIEVAAILLFGFLALSVDRQQTLKSRGPDGKTPHTPRDDD